MMTPTKWMKPILSILLAAVLATPSLGQAPSVKNKVSKVVTTRPAAKPAPPSWFADSKWYDVFVKRFRNGDTSNDLNMVKEWTAEPFIDAKTKLPTYGGMFGGDLAGLQSKLGYLKALGINTLCISDIFPSDYKHDNNGKVLSTTPANLRHLWDGVRVNESAFRIEGETEDPKTWKYSQSDRLFHQLVKSAHESGIRVVMSVSGEVSVPEALFLTTLRRWMDPDGDGDPADGVDGWMISRSENSKESMLRWQAAVKAINPSAITVAGGTGDDSHPFDVQKHSESGTVLNSLRSIKSKKQTKTPSGLPTFDMFGRISNRLAKSGFPQERMLQVLNAVHATTPGKALVTEKFMQDADQVLATLRLGIIIQHFLPGAPMTDAGEEVGMYGFKDGFQNTPMWWNDLPGAKTKARDYREDLQSLVQWLHMRRDIDEPLRRGKFRTVLVDDRNETVVLARTMPGKEIFLVVNCSDKKQKVMVPVGQPGDMVALLTPHLTLGPKARPIPRGPGGIRPLPMGGNKQLVNHEGEVRVWVKPLSVRYILREDR